MKRSTNVKVPVCKKSNNFNNNNDDENYDDRKKISNDGHGSRNYEKNKQLVKRKRRKK